MLNINQTAQLPAKVYSSCFAEACGDSYLVLGFFDGSNGSILRCPALKLSEAERVPTSLQFINAIVPVPGKPNLLVLGGRDGLVLYDIETNSDFRPVPGFAEDVYTFDASRRGMRFLCACSDENIWEVDLALDTAQIVTETGESTSSISVHPNGIDVIYTNDDWEEGILTFWKRSEPELFSHRTFESDKLRVRFSPNGEYFVSADRYVRVFRHPDRTYIWVYSGKDDFTLPPVPGGGSYYGWTTPIFSPDSKIVFSGSITGSIYAWDIENREVLCVEAAHKGPILSLAINGDGTMLASCGEDLNLKLWDVAL